ncbi:MAG: Bro-N domain-containing protein [Flavobacteriales bacterium]|nr:Bro-N domain-containing protein [Flavobacteriales bacterium]
MSDSKDDKIAVFESKTIRKAWHNNEWFFSIVDVVGALSDSSNPTDYLKKIRKRDEELKHYIGTNCPQVEMFTESGKKRTVLAGNTEHVFRVIQSIPSPKAEPFKRWLAKVGYERVEEIENPELAQERMKEIYEQKGYDKDWIDKRLRGIAVRQNLTDEWKERGIKASFDYSILTAEISKATFGMTPSEYKKHKNIPVKSKVNLRDNMTDLELIFTMLGERVTTEISQNENPEGMSENKNVAKRGGKVAGDARKNTEKEIGRSIISGVNYLPKDMKKSLSNRKRK